MNAATMLNTTVQIDRVISIAADAMPWRIPLYRAARGANIPKALLRQNKPAIVLLGDDDHQSTGPDGWICARRAKYWAAAGMLHAAGGNPEHYATAVAGVLNYRRIVLVETDSTNREAWIRFLRPTMPLLIVRTPQGILQPRPFPTRHAQ